MNKINKIKISTHIDIQFKCADLDVATARVWDFRKRLKSDKRPGKKNKLNKR